MNKSEIIEKIKQNWQALSILGIASVLRLSIVSLRPCHHDEGVFGWFTDQITANGFYTYDPNNYHGPFHYYVLFLFKTLLGENTSVLRLPDALIGILTVYWFLLFSPFLGRAVCLIAALAMALSPGIVYYGGYAFQESFMVFYAVLILWGIMGLWFEGSRKYLWAIGLGITFMILTKETFIVNVAAFIISWICLSLYEKKVPSEQSIKAEQQWNKKDLLYITAVGLFLIIFFYSGTFYNSKGVLDFFQAFEAYFKMGMTVSGHNKPFIYWTKLMFQYEHIALLGLLATILYLKPSSKWIRYIAIYGLGMYLAYSIIKYKTPWCIVNILWPFYFVFADTVYTFFKSKNKSDVKMACAILFLLSAFITIKLNFIDNANSKEPYVYVHTFKDISKITEPLYKLAHKDASNYNLTGIVKIGGEWPIPWLLRDFTMIGYYGSNSSPQSYDADFIYIEKGKTYLAEDSLLNKYFTDEFSLRDAQGPSKLYLSYEKFKDIFPGRNPEFIPRPPEPIIPGQGLLAIYYPNATVQGQFNGSPVIKKVFSKIEIYLDEKSTLLPPPYGIELLGEINIPSQNTTLILSSDDGGYVEIEGKRIIEDLGSHGEHAKSAIIKDLQGWRKIKIGYYNIWGYSVLRLKWIDSAGNEVYVPAGSLRFSEGLLKQ